MKINISIKVSEQGYTLDYSIDDSSSITTEGYWKQPAPSTVDLATGALHFMPAMMEMIEASARQMEKWRILPPRTSSFVL